ncbi:phage antirepressor KilAC domain-containing protein [Microbacterium saperdae]
MAAGWGNPAAIAAEAWPVAPIPAPPTANHPTGVLIPLRWPLHGDLRILVDELNVFVASEDLHALAEFDDGYAHPTVTARITWARTTGAPLTPFYTLAEAMAVLDHNPTHATGELLAWFREQLPLATGDEAIDHAIGLVSFTDAWTVRQAAMILDRDPQISIGRTRLFAHLEHIGWAQRAFATGTWAPLPYATRHGYLTLRDIIIRSGTRAAEAYTQLYVTEDGLTELRRSLNALYPAPPDPVEPEQLPIPD